MTPQDRLLHICAFELRQLIHLQDVAGMVLPLRRAAQVVGWKALIDGWGEVVQWSREELQLRIRSWIPVLERGELPNLQGSTPSPHPREVLPEPPPETSTMRADRRQEIRISLQQLESLFAHAGELTVLRNRLEEHVRRLQGLEGAMVGLDRETRITFSENLRQLRQDQSELNRISAELTRQVIDLRLRPASLMVTPLERLVRDLARGQNKKLHFETSGTDTELDRNLLDPLRDALMHLIRNAIDHGLETPEERRRSGKPEVGRLGLHIQSRGESIQLTLSDDGRGIQLERVRQKAIERGMVQDQDLLSQEEVHDLLFQPGFSTAQQVSSISGRGVGLDAVRANVDLLGGEVWLSSVEGEGTTFHLRLPQTLATTRAFVVRVSDQAFALPSRHVDRILKPDHFTVVDQKRTVEWQGNAIPVFELSEVLGLPPSGAPVTVILNLAERCVGINVQQVTSEEEFVMKHLPWGIPASTAFQGVVMDRSGALLPVLNVAQLSVQARPRPAAQVQTARKKQRILVADDSVAVRTIQRSVLELAGFEVQVAENGRIALQMLRQHSFDLLVSDVEMPEMTGLDLTREIRKDERLKHLPVILVTSMATPQHREEGMLAGADAYLIKGNYAPEDLLDTLGRLI
ncbi:hybrid sensor histidine kinase/response regulator [Deinococcus cellulosilyticus]|uniref:histidine kinase n=1 Tax=Deinococcus cellulosilyticus (strain DSM 18568 / NBRC 106333 / KACC 11606 / 5516J-15) TaxID=1223518 RepID=A0A511MUV3_DEIC1|nr:response regulator [Deinococcus cellulosilyticus]GEM44384.1 hybrid sensor histidine kinase/response regulator [Deinococcus cellulosilyticus NBRC 106333 = KACC 11606]